MEGGLEEVQSGGNGHRDAGPEVEGEAHASPRSLLPGPVPVVSWQHRMGWMRVGFSCLTHTCQLGKWPGQPGALKNHDLETLRRCGAWARKRCPESRGLTWQRVIITCESAGLAHSFCRKVGNY